MATFEPRSGKIEVIHYGSIEIYLDKGGEIQIIQGGESVWIPSLNILHSLIDLIDDSRIENQKLVLKLMGDLLDAKTQ